jgi:hypothetical protein
MDSTIFTHLASAMPIISFLPTVLVLLFAIMITSLWLFTKADKIDIKEPSLAHSKIPLFGQLIGLLWHQNHYFDLIR